MQCTSLHLIVSLAGARVACSQAVINASILARELACNLPSQPAEAHPCFSYFIQSRVVQRPFGSMTNAGIF